MAFCKIPERKKWQRPLTILISSITMEIRFRPVDAGPQEKEEVGSIMKFSAKTLIALLGIALAVLSFLLPFATATAAGESESLIGFEVMTAADDSDEFCVTFFALLAFLGGLAAIVTLFLGKAKLSGILSVVCFALQLLFLVTFDRQSESFWGVSISLKAGVGAWLSMIFFAAAAVFALLGDKFAFLSRVKVDSVAQKFDAAAGSFQKTVGNVSSSIQTGVKAARSAAAAKSELACPNCGAKNAADSQFCQSCGAKLEPPAPPVTDDVRFCPNCGTKLSADSQFCPNCGHKS